MNEEELMASGQSLSITSHLHATMASMAARMDALVEVVEIRGAQLDALRLICQAAFNAAGDNPGVRVPLIDAIRRAMNADPTLALEASGTGSPHGLRRELVLELLPQQIRGAL
ncbi:hypothetical protein ACS5PN_00265 [Roseateles sp. NT4]|uniref:hypothetical protein n=1 Tax=Roseateles sp. NT4 TaxID=3453715 RepID=UPI003EEDF04E